MENFQERIVSKNFELKVNSPELQKRLETEARFLVESEDNPDYYQDISEKIEQVYISSEHDEYSLRVRSKEDKNGDVSYYATLKDRGTVNNGAISRLEFETEISSEAFHFYKDNPSFPRLTKVRANLSEGVSLDFIQGLNKPILEIEDSNYQEIAETFSDLELTNISEIPTYSNESLAYRLSELPTPERPKDIDQFIEELKDLALEKFRSGKTYTVIGITGASGSGKSTAARQLQRRVAEVVGSELGPIVISTDDYHKGRKYLESTYGAPWKNWDDPRTYDTVAFAEDLRNYKNGHNLLNRYFDFQSEEIVYGEVFKPSPFIIVEGIYASSKDLEDELDEHFYMPTGHATSLGRDAIRIITKGRANAAFRTPEERLKYQIETALPTFIKEH